MNVHATTTMRIFLYQGIGAENYFLREEGLFTVSYQDGVKPFETLVGAYLFYLELKGSATIWDVTEIPVLVESKTVIK